MTIQQTIQEYTKDTLVVLSYEIDHLGNKTDLVVGDHYSITSGNSQALTSGSKDFLLMVITNYTLIRVGLSLTTTIYR